MNNQNFQTLTRIGLVALFGLILLAGSGCNNAKSQVKAQGDPSQSNLIINVPNKGNLDKVPPKELDSLFDNLKK